MVCGFRSFIFDEVVKRVWDFPGVPAKALEDQTLTPYASLGVRLL
jgi:hypothetical protein